MRHEEIINIIKSDLEDYIKYDRIINNLCGRPIYEIELLGIGKRGRRCRTVSFNNLDKLLKYKNKLDNRRYPIHEAKLRIGYYKDAGKCYFL